MATYRIVRDSKGSVVGVKAVSAAPAPTQYVSTSRGVLPESEVYPQAPKAPTVYQKYFEPKAPPSEPTFFEKYVPPEAIKKEEPVAIIPKVEEKVESLEDKQKAKKKDLEEQVEILKQLEANKKKKK